MKYLTPEEQQKRDLGLLQDYINDVPVKEIALTYGIKPDTIYQIAKKYNIWRRIKRFDRKAYIREKYNRDYKREKPQTEVDRIWIDKQICALTKQGLGVKHIARAYNVDIVRIAKARREGGLSGFRVSITLEKGMSDFNGMKISDITPFVTARPKRFL